MDKDSPDRKGWDNQGKTQFVSMLHNMDLIRTQMPTLAIETKSTEASKISKTITVSEKTSQQNSGKTIIISESAASAEIGETITISEKITSIVTNDNNDNNSKTIVVSTNKNEDAVKKTNQKEVEEIEELEQKQKEIEHTNQTKDQNADVTNQSEENKEQDDGLEVIELNTEQVKTEIKITSNDSKEGIVTAWSGNLSVVHQSMNE